MALFLLPKTPPTKEGLRMNKCQNCGDDIFYLDDAMDPKDNGWKHIIASDSVRILGNKGCSKPEPKGNNRKKMDGHICCWNDVKTDGIYCTTCSKKEQISGENLKLWANKNELEWLKEMKDEGRTRVIKMSTFPQYKTQFTKYLEGKDNEENWEIDTFYNSPPDEEIEVEIKMITTPRLCYKCREGNHCESCCDANIDKELPECICNKKILEQKNEGL